MSPVRDTTGTAASWLVGGRRRASAATRGKATYECGLSLFLEGDVAAVVLALFEISGSMVESTGC